MEENSANNPNSLMQVDPEINFFGLTNYRNQFRKFGIKIDDRRRHMYLVGKTGMGKTTILENMVLNDIYAGHGVGLVDPHGDFAEKVLDFVPPHRINDVVYFNPSDVDFPIGFNILESINPEYRHLVASGLMGVFKKIWPDVWSARMEYILNNTILALLDYPDTTLLGINRLLADDDFRDKVVKNLKDPVVRSFWVDEFDKYEERFRREAIAPIQNKIGQFLSASIIRNIVAQVKSRINIREIMDTKKIFIMNLSKGRIGEDNSRLLGGMLITKIQLSAMERVDTPEAQRSDFFLYVDEFQNFATESFANILSEARKYRLDLIMAHQYMEQLDEKVLAAVIGNVGTMLTFRVGSTDAEILAKEFIPTFVEEDLVNLPKFHIYLKLMIDGVASRPFSALTLPPIGSATGSRDKVIRSSRERYAVPRDKIEEKIARWSGMEVDGDEEDESSSDASGGSSKPPQKENNNRSSQSSNRDKDRSSQQKSSYNKSSNSGKGGSDRPKSYSTSQSVKTNSGSFNKESTSQSSIKNQSTPIVPFDSKQVEKVLLVDTAQPGISLEQAFKTAPPKQMPPKVEMSKGAAPSRFSDQKKSTERIDRARTPQRVVQNVGEAKPATQTSVSSIEKKIEPRVITNFNRNQNAVRQPLSRNGGLEITSETPQLSLNDLKKHNRSSVAPSQSRKPVLKEESSSVVLPKNTQTLPATPPTSVTTQKPSVQTGSVAPSTPSSDQPQVITPGEVIKFD